MLQVFLVCLLLLQPSTVADSDDNNCKMWQQLAEVITPSIVKVVDFAKSVPGFDTVSIKKYHIALVLVFHNHLII